MFKLLIADVFKWGREEFGYVKKYNAEHIETEASLATAKFHHGVLSSWKNSDTNGETDSNWPHVNKELQLVVLAMGLPSHRSS